MGMMIGSLFGGSSSIRRVITIKNRDGSAAGTLSITKASAKKKKKLSYSFTKLSNAILRSKTSMGAKKAATQARITVATLLRKMNTGEYDDEDLQAAVLHARKMERIAKKRERHMEQEERAEREGSCLVEKEEDRFSDLQEAKDSEDSGNPENSENTENLEKEAEISEEELQQLMQEYQQLMQELMDSLQEDTGLRELADEMMGSVTEEDMSPEDLERLKKKHRSDELREITDANMKYLKAVFQKLEREKQSAGQSAAAGSGQDGGLSSGLDSYSTAVLLEVDGDELPVQATEAPPAAEGGSVDVTL